MTWLIIPLVVILAAPVVVGAFFAAVKGDPPPYKPPSSPWRGRLSTSDQYQLTKRGWSYLGPKGKRHDRRYWHHDVPRRIREVDDRADWP